MTTTLALQPGAGVPAAEVPTLDAGALRARLAAPGELALIDVREEGVRSRDGHILQSVPLPLGQIELRAAALLPRFGAPVVVTDAGDGDRAFRAARRLAELGYTDVSVLEGGVAAWAAAGGVVYTGANVLSKAFGEFVEHAYGTPRLPAREVKARLDRGEDLVVLDGRTFQEFETFHIPGAHAVPNAELPLRVHDLVASDATLVVVNCAGRTRSIIGAQALINAGIPNPVVALENGTMAWLFEGYDLAQGDLRPAPAPGAKGLEKARATVSRLAQRFGIRALDAAGLARFEAERGARTLYVLDVRTRAEFEAGHLPGAVWAEGGQLVQATDRWVGTRNARIVLVDDADGVRAAITASWLIQLGVGEVHVHAIDPGAADLERGPERTTVLGRAPTVAVTTVAGLERLLAREAAVVLDLDTSLAYAAGHIPGARFAVRARLPEGLDSLPQRPLVVTSADGRLAALAAADLAGAGRQVSVLEGGTAAWRAAGLPIETGETALLHVADDVWRSPYQEGGDRHAAFRRYLDWEIALIDQIGRDDTIAFKVYP
ncbi:rhodanese-like domain-containing protein [Xanthobacter sp. V3C-3]|uniref:rhodanese-like domain-containing protein n=1 Tax=Xanthobacter lutulentifluminis TaxID=3119935 RepID=UPI00372B8CBD